MAESQAEACELCGRVGVRLTRHHLIPVARHKKPRTRRRHDRAELRTRVAWLCEPCHKTVHATLSEQELAEHYHTLDRLAAHPDIAGFVVFVRKRPPDAHVAVRPRNDRRAGNRRTGRTGSRRAAARGPGIATPAARLVPPRTDPDPIV